MAIPALAYFLIFVYFGKTKKRMLLIPGTGNRSLGTNVQRQPAWEFKMGVKTKERLVEKQFG